jgi:hypothetical protein
MSLIKITNQHNLEANIPEYMLAHCLLQGAKLEQEISKEVKEKVKEELTQDEFEKVKDFLNFNQSQNVKSK